MIPMNLFPVWLARGAPIFGLAAAGHGGVSGDEGEPDGRRLVPDRLDQLGY